VNGKELAAKDQARIDVEEALVLKASDAAELILLDVPSRKGWGYRSETLREKNR